MSFERKNLAYIVRPTENKQEELLHILNSVPRLRHCLYPQPETYT